MGMAGHRFLVTEVEQALMQCASFPQLMIHVLCTNEILLLPNSAKQQPSTADVELLILFDPGERYNTKV